MGTGKSRAARILADGLDWQLADTDRMMEKDTGMRIAEYYQSCLLYTSPSPRDRG